ncbi:SH3 domain-containing protein [Ekhidna sp.]|uniref:SH3 domain-containing protein n=1 Tax=Ekhidna sp. TaxID=2608089 RepID=UPI003CCC1795
MIDRINVRLFVGILFYVQFLDLSAQNTTLDQGDSLFNQQQYTEAFDVYEEIYSSGQFTSAMLLKMAFIQDGLGNYAEALYFLDKYYAASADRQVIGKIEELVEAHELRGFSYNDTDYFLALLSKYRAQMLLILISISVLLLVYIFRKSKMEEPALAAGVIQIIILLFILGVNNINPTKQGIIIADNTLLRSGPSAGAEPIEILPKGHKLTIIDQDNVWTKVQWDGKEVFIRNARLKII